MKLNQIFSNENKRFNTDCNYNLEAKNISNFEPLSHREKNKLNFEDNFNSKSFEKNEKHYNEFKCNNINNNDNIYNQNNNCDVIAENNDFNNFDNNNNNHYGADSRR